MIDSMLQGACSFWLTWRQVKRIGMLRTGRVQVTVYTSLGMCYRRHIGGPVRGITLRADPNWGGSQTARVPVFDYVAVK